MMESGARPVSSADLIETFKEKFISRKMYIPVTIISFIRNKMAKHVMFLHTNNII